MEFLPAIPPEDYEGSISAWMAALLQRGLWDGDGFYGDVEISVDDWNEILVECEN